MNVPIILIPPMAIFMACNHYKAFYKAPQESPSKLMWLAKAIVEVWIACLYLFFAFQPGYSAERAEAVRLAVFVLFGTHTVAILIEKNTIYQAVQRGKQAVKNLPFLRPPDANN